MSGTAEREPEPDPQPEDAAENAAAADEQRRAALLARVREANKWSAGRPV